MAKSKVTKRSFSGYETQRIILGVLLLALIVASIVFGYQIRRENGDLTSEVIYEESTQSQEGAQ